MSKTSDELHRIRDLVDQLIALDAAFWRARAEYRRGGLPATSMGADRAATSDGSPMLTHDRTDHQLNTDTKAYIASMRRTTTELAASVRMITAWTVPVPPLPEPQPAPCQRLTCDKHVTNLGSDRLRPSPIDGLRICMQCYMRERRTVGVDTA